MRISVSTQLESLKQIAQAANPSLPDKLSMLKVFFESIPQLLGRARNATLDFLNKLTGLSKEDPNLILPSSLEFIDALWRIPLEEVEALRKLHHTCLNEQINTGMPAPEITPGRHFDKHYIIPADWNNPEATGLLTREVTDTNEPANLTSPNIKLNCTSLEALDLRLLPDTCSYRIPVAEGNALHFCKGTNATLGTKYDAILNTPQDWRGAAVHQWALVDSFREFLQNFFDAHETSDGKKTLEGVSFSIKKHTGGFSLSITGNGAFHPDFVLLDGASDKPGVVGDSPGQSRSAIGQHGDGSKTAIANLLSQDNATAVKIQSTNWGLSFTQGTTAESAIENAISYKLTKKETVEETSIYTIEFSDSADINATVTALKQAISQFYFPDNPNFFGEFRYENSYGGFALPYGGYGGIMPLRHSVPISDQDSGQISYNPYPGLSFWTNQRYERENGWEGESPFDKQDRNRGAIPSRYIGHYIGEPVIRAMSDDDIALAIYALRKYGDSPEGYKEDCLSHQPPGLALLLLLRQAAFDRRIGFRFPATGPEPPRNLAWLVPVPDRPKPDKYKEKPPSPQETIKINCLKQAAKLIIESLNLNLVQGEFYPSQDSQSFVNADPQVQKLITEERARELGISSVIKWIPQNLLEAESMISALPYFICTSGSYCIPDCNSREIERSAFRYVDHSESKLRRLKPTSYSESPSNLAYLILKLCTHPPKHIARQIRHLNQIWQANNSENLNQFDFVSRAQTPVT